MLIVISPAKSLDFETPVPTEQYTLPEFSEKGSKLADKLRKLSPDNLQTLMGISPALAQLNYERFQMWQPNFSVENSRQALFAFKGDVYTGMDAYSLSEDDILASQKHLRILSGLYGVLRPLDLMRPYRLEMGTDFSYQRKKNLYEFWKEDITKNIRTALNESGSNLLVNLASNEYFKAIDKKKLGADIVTPAFKDLKNGQYKMISFWAKKARGLMTRFIIQNNITNPEELTAFDLDGYYYNPEMSKPNAPVFTRDH